MTTQEIVLDNQQLHEQTPPSMLPLLPLKNIIILPKSIHPVIVGRPQSIKAVEYALQHDKALFISTQKDEAVENPTDHDVYSHGTRATILQIMRIPNGSFKILVEGICRARITGSQQLDGFTGVTYEDLITTSLDQAVELEALWRTLRRLYESYAKLNEKVPTELFAMVKTVEDMDAVSDTLAVHLNLTSAERQELLETSDLVQRLSKNEYADRQRD